MKVKIEKMEGSSNNYSIDKLLASLIETKIANGRNKVKGTTTESVVIKNEKRDQGCISVIEDFLHIYKVLGYNSNPTEKIAILEK